MKTAACFVVFCLLALASASAPASPAFHWDDYPPGGYVPDAATAVKIARAVSIPLYSAESVSGKKFTAKLNGNVWAVRGTPLPGQAGEAIDVTISRKTGAILGSDMATVVHFRHRPPSSVKTKT